MLFKLRVLHQNALTVGLKKLKPNVSKPRLSNQNQSHFKKLQTQKLSLMTILYDFETAFII